MPVSKKKKGKKVGKAKAAKAQTLKKSEVKELMKTKDGKKRLIAQANAEPRLCTKCKTCKMCSRYFKLL